MNDIPPSPSQSFIEKHKRRLRLKSVSKNVRQRITLVKEREDDKTPREYEA
jgi:hypothetical protein